MRPGSAPCWAPAQTPRRVRSRPRSARGEPGVQALASSTDRTNMPILRTGRSEARSPLGPIVGLRASVRCTDPFLNCARQDRISHRAGRLLGTTMRSRLHHSRGDAICDAPEARISPRGPPRPVGLRRQREGREGDVRRRKWTGFRRSDARVRRRREARPAPVRLLEAASTAYELAEADALVRISPFFRGRAQCPGTSSSRVSTRPWFHPSAPSVPGHCTSR